VVTPPAWPSESGRGGPVVDFYNAGADFGAPIAAETAREGRSELCAGRLSAVS
jgi:hypothetical protein